MLENFSIVLQIPDTVQQVEDSSIIFTEDLLWEFKVFVGSQDLPWAEWQRCSTVFHCPILCFDDDLLAPTHGQHDSFTNVARSYEFEVNINQIHFASTSSSVASLSFILEVAIVSGSLHHPLLSGIVPFQIIDGNKAIFQGMQASILKPGILQRFDVDLYSPHMGKPDTAIELRRPLPELSAPFQLLFRPNFYPSISTQEKLVPRVFFTPPLATLTTIFDGIFVNPHTPYNSRFPIAVFSSLVLGNGAPLSSAQNPHGYPQFLGYLPQQPSPLIRYAPQSSLPLSGMSYQPRLDPHTFLRAEHPLPVLAGAGPENLQHPDLHLLLYLVVKNPSVRTENTADGPSDAMGHCVAFSYVRLCDAEGKWLHTRVRGIEWMETLQLDCIVYQGSPTVLPTAPTSAVPLLTPSNVPMLPKQDVFGAKESGVPPHLDEITVTPSLALTFSLPVAITVSLRMNWACVSPLSPPSLYTTALSVTSKLPKKILSNHPNLREFIALAMAQRLDPFELPSLHAVEPSDLALSDLPYVLPKVLFQYCSHISHVLTLHNTSALQPQPNKKHWLLHPPPSFVLKELFQRHLSCDSASDAATAHPILVFLDLMRCIACPSLTATRGALLPSSLDSYLFGEGNISALAQYLGGILPPAPCLAAFLVSRWMASAYLSAFSTTPDQRLHLVFRRWAALLLPLLAHLLTQEEIFGQFVAFSDAPLSHPHLPWILAYSRSFFHLLSVFTWQLDQQPRDRYEQEWLLVHDIARASLSLYTKLSNKGPFGTWFLQEIEQSWLPFLSRALGQRCGYPLVTTHSLLHAESVPSLDLGATADSLSASVPAPAAVTPRHPSSLNASILDKYHHAVNSIGRSGRNEFESLAPSSSAAAMSAIHAPKFSRQQLSTIDPLLSPNYGSDHIHSSSNSYIGLSNATTDVPHDYENSARSYSSLSTTEHNRFVESNLQLQKIVYPHANLPLDDGANELWAGLVPSELVVPPALKVDIARFTELLTTELNTEVDAGSSMTRYFEHAIQPTMLLHDGIFELGRLSKLELLSELFSFLSMVPYDPEHYILWRNLCNLCLSLYISEYTRYSKSFSSALEPNSSDPVLHSAFWNAEAKVSLRLLTSLTRGLIRDTSIMHVSLHALLPALTQYYASLTRYTNTRHVQHPPGIRVLHHRSRSLLALVMDLSTKAVLHESPHSLTACLSFLEVLPRVLNTLHSELGGEFLQEKMPMAQAIEIKLGSTEHLDGGLVALEQGNIQRICRNILSFLNSKATTTSKSMPHSFSIPEAEEMSMVLKLFTDKNVHFPTAPIFESDFANTLYTVLIFYRVSNDSALSLSFLECIYCILHHGTNTSDAISTIQISEFIRLSLVLLHEVYILIIDPLYPEELLGLALEMDIAVTDDGHLVRQFRSIFTSLSSTVSCLSTSRPGDAEPAFHTYLQLPYLSLFSSKSMAQHPKEGDSRRAALTAPFSDIFGEYHNSNFSSPAFDLFSWMTFGKLRAKAFAPIVMALSIQKDKKRPVPQGEFIMAQLKHAFKDMYLYAALVTSSLQSSDQRAFFQQYLASIISVVATMASRYEKQESTTPYDYHVLSCLLSAPQAADVSALFAPYEYHPDPSFRLPTPSGAIQFLHKVNSIMSAGDLLGETNHQSWESCPLTHDALYATIACALYEDLFQIPEQAVAYLPTGNPDVVYRFATFADQSSPFVDKLSLAHIHRAKSFLRLFASSSYSFRDFVTGDEVPLGLSISLLLSSITTALTLCVQSSNLKSARDLLDQWRELLLNLATHLNVSFSVLESTIPNFHAYLLSEAGRTVIPVDSSESQHLTTTSMVSYPMRQENKRPTHARYSASQESATEILNRSDILVLRHLEPAFLAKKLPSARILGTNFELGVQTTLTAMFAMLHYDVHVVSNLLQTLMEISQGADADAIHVVYEKRSVVFMRHFHGLLQTPAESLHSALVEAITLLRRDKAKEYRLVILHVDTSSGAGAPPTHGLENLRCNWEIHTLPVQYTLDFLAAFLTYSYPEASVFGPDAPITLFQRQEEYIFAGTGDLPLAWQLKERAHHIYIYPIATTRINATNDCIPLSKSSGTTINRNNTLEVYFPVAVIQAVQHRPRSPPESVGNLRRMGPIIHSGSFNLHILPPDAMVTESAYESRVRTGTFKALITLPSQNDVFGRVFGVTRPVHQPEVMPVPLFEACANAISNLSIEQPVAPDSSNLQSCDLIPQAAWTDYLQWKGDVLTCVFAHPIQHNQLDVSNTLAASSVLALSEDESVLLPYSPEIWLNCYLQSLESKSVEFFWKSGPSPMSVEIKSAFQPVFSVSPGFIQSFLAKRSRFFQPSPMDSTVATYMSPRWYFSVGPRTLVGAILDYTQLKRIERQKITTGMRRVFCRKEEQLRAEGVADEAIPTPDWEKVVPHSIHSRIPWFDLQLVTFCKQ